MKQQKPHLPAARLPPAFRRQPGRQAGSSQRKTLIISLCALWLIFINWEARFTLYRLSKIPGLNIHRR